MSFPRELLEREIWVDWRLTPDKDGGKDRKVPFNPMTGKAAKSNDPASWGTYDQVVEARDHYAYTGIGFMFWPDADIESYGPEDVRNCSFGRHLEARDDDRTYDIVHGGQAFYHKIVTDLRDFNVSGR